MTNRGDKVTLLGLCVAKTLFSAFETRDRRRRVVKVSLAYKNISTESLLINRRHCSSRKVLPIERSSLKVYMASTGILRQSGWLNNVGEAS